MNFFFRHHLIRHARQSFLGALRQSLLYREWESECVRVVHAATGNYRRVRIGGYSLINCYPIPSGDDRRSTVTVVHKRSDMIYDAPWKGTLRKLRYIVSDACFDRITSIFLHALSILRRPKANWAGTVRPHIFVNHSHGSSGFSSTGGYVTVSAVTPAFTTRTRHMN